MHCSVYLSRSVGTSLKLLEAFLPRFFPCFSFRHIFPKNETLEIREGNNNDRHIVKSPSHQCILDNVLNSKAALLVNISSSAI